MRPLLKMGTSAMNDDDERRPNQTRDLIVPSRLDNLSVDEMTSLRNRLQAEIARLEQEIDRRAEARRAADALFKQRAD
jgi:uncharacterized small protein (DUF1192 family)